MEIAREGAAVVTTATRDEALVIQSCMLEALEELGQEFEVRVGAGREETMNLLHQLTDFLREPGRGS